jgi:uncharacterized membrane protein YdjX (TVP38/TMEM64 family)
MLHDMRRFVPALVIVFVLLLLLLLLLLRMPASDLPDPQRLLEWAQKLEDSWQALAIFFLIYAFGNFMFIPIPVITLAASAIFPSWKVIACGVLGTLASALIGYALGRLIDLSRWPRRLQYLAFQIRGRLEKREGWAVMFLRLAPTPPFTVTSIVSGSCRMPWFSYVLGSVAGITPHLILVNLFGLRMLNLLQDPGTMALLMLLIMGILLGLYHFGSRRLMKSRSAR